MRLLPMLALLSLVLFGCGAGDSAGRPGKPRKSELLSYELVRDVKAGEKLEMGMLKPMSIVSRTVKDDVLTDLLLTSADINAFLGKPFKKSVKQGAFLEKELFQ